jgi:hypothetical protein
MPVSHFFKTQTQIKYSKGEGVDDSSYQDSSRPDHVDEGVSELDPRFQFNRHVNTNIDPFTFSKMRAEVVLGSTDNTIHQYQARLILGNSSTETSLPPIESVSQRVIDKKQKELKNRNALGWGMLLAMIVLSKAGIPELTRIATSNIELKNPANKEDIQNEAIVENIGNEIYNFGIFNPKDRRENIIGKSELAKFEYRKKLAYNFVNQLYQDGKITSIDQDNLLESLKQNDYNSTFLNQIKDENILKLFLLKFKQHGEK